MKWIISRITEPSSWAAGGVIIIGVGVVILKEKGIL